MKKFLLIVSCTVLISGFFTYKTHYYLLNIKNEVLLLFSETKSEVINLDKIYLNIDSTELNKLLEYRNNAISNAFIGPKEKKKIKGSVKINDTNYNAKIKLSGHAWDHLGGDGLSKTSLTIHIPNKSKFSLRHPTTRSYLYEWILHKALEKKKYQLLNIVLSN
jgi:hypothetical protein